MRQMDRVLEIKRVPAEYIRGIAIVFVVLGHILGGTFGIIDTHITSILGIGGVTIFLLLSGYGLYQSYQKNGLQGKTYWDKKIEKVFLPYAVITVIYYLYMMIRGTAPGYPALLRNILCIDYARTMDGTMWYMSFLPLWYLAFFCVFYFKGATAGKVGMLVLLGLAFHSYWLKDTFGPCAWQFSTNAFAFPCGVALGYSMDLYNRSCISPKWKAWICLLLRIGVFAGSLVVLMLSILQTIQIAYWKCGIAVFFVLYTLLSLPKKEIKVLKWLGASSFLIYLIEGKLIAIWGQFKFLKGNLVVYLVSYAAVTVAIVYLYRFGSMLLGRLRRFEAATPDDHQIEKN